MNVSSNRRTHERFPFASRLEVRPVIATRGPVISAQAFDVSVGGFGFRSPLAWQVGELIAVALPEIETTGRDAPARSKRGRDDTGKRSNAVSSHAAPTHLQIVAIVRHVHPEGGEFVVGAERHAD